MISRSRLRGAVLMAALAAAGWLLSISLPARPGATEPTDQGFGPLALGQRFDQAERLAFRVAPETAFSGTGCSGLDEIRYEGWLSGQPVGIMAMAGNGHIEEIEVTLLAPDRADSLEACRELRDGFAQAFTERFGSYQSSWQVNKPVSQELLARTGPVLLAARWFSAGGSC